VAGPLYKKIKFCRKPETLWGKIESGGWDWLGVHPNGQFVLGSPRVRRLELRGTATLTSRDAVEGEHGVGSRAPLSPGTSFR
jgi:hypothetical protein